MRERAVQILVVVAFAGVMIYSGLFLGREYTKVATFVRMGDIWSFLRLDDEPGAVFAEVDTEDFVQLPHPVAGDTLLTMDGRTATAEAYFDLFSPDTPPGAVYPIEFTHEGQVHESAVRTRSIPAALRLQVSALFVLRVLMTLGLSLVGFWAFVRKPQSPAVRILALFCFSLAVSMLLNGAAIADGYARFDFPWRAESLVGFAAFGFLAPVFWVKLQLRFPATSRFYETHCVRVNLALFGVTLALVIARGLTPTVQPLLNLHRLVFLAAGFYLLVRNAMNADTFLTRRQTWLVLMGSVPGLALYGVYPFLEPAARWLGRDLTVVARMVATNVTFLAMLLTPITFALALNRYRLLEVQGRLKRGSRLVAVNALLLLTFGGLLYGFGDFLLRALSIQNRTPTLLLGVSLALVLAPGMLRLRYLIEDWILPERRRLRALLAEFAEETPITRDIASFWRVLCTSLAGVLKTNEVYPVIRRQGAEIRLAAGPAFAPLKDPDSLFERLADVRHPLFVDEMVASGRFDLRDEELRWFENCRAVVLLPLVGPSGLMGFLLLGPKENGEDYSPEEMYLLRALGAQVALRVENVRLLEDSLERQKLQDQLDIGREIQKGLLPRTLPEVRGLELAARIRFCLDVAGDYYDVVPLADNCTLLAIGDVAGKGVGPALLMSNLQALLRSVRGSEVDLPRMAERINALVYENTPSEMFITFFVAVFCPDTRRLTYVNAGHNPPLLLRGDGRTQELAEGGLILGALPQAAYVQGEVTLAGADTVIMYTDGVTEAHNGSRVEFGEQRIVALASRNGGRSLEQTLQEIEAAVQAYTGSTEFEDDFTLLAVRAQ